MTNISPRNILSAFCPTAYLHPANSNPKLSKFASDFDTAFVAFHLVVPHISSLNWNILLRETTGGINSRYVANVCLQLTPP